MMKQLTFEEAHSSQLIDIRPQRACQAAYPVGAINLIPRNFQKYHSAVLNPEHGLVLITDEANQNLLEEFLENMETDRDYKVLGYLLVDHIPTDQIDHIPTISAEDFLNLEGDFQLLDLRKPSEITRPAPPKNLINIPLESLPDELASLKSHQMIYVLCGSGNRATTGATFLLNRGFDVTVIEGGMKAVQEVQRTL